MEWINTFHPDPILLCAALLQACAVLLGLCAWISHRADKMVMRAGKLIDRAYELLAETRATLDAGKEPDDGVD